MAHETYISGGRWRIPRSRGATGGLLLILLGVWGALIPFLGPTFDYAFTPDSAWTWTAGRFWLSVLPGVAAILGGLILLVSADRVTAALGAWLAVPAGAWFVVGPSLAPLWDANAVGTPIGGTTRQTLEWIGFFYGLGAVVLFLASTAFGRLSVHSVRDVKAAWRRQARREATLREAAVAETAPRRPAVGDLDEPLVYPSDTGRARRDTLPLPTAEGDRASADQSDWSEYAARASEPAPPADSAPARPDRSAG